MALVAFEGFDHYSAVAGDILNRRGGAFQWTTEFDTVIASPGRNNFGSCLVLNNTAQITATLTSPITSGFIGFGWRVTGSNALFNSGQFSLLDMHSGGQAQITFVCNGARNGIDVFRGSTLIATSANNSLTFATWNYVEFGVTIGGAGSISVRVNGQTIIDVSGINTQSTGNSYFDGFSFVSNPTSTSTATSSLDDLYIADTSVGSGLFPLNIFAGDVRVVTLNTVGNGASTMWTPLALTNWQEVSEVRSDGDASYNSTSTPGAKDLFNFEALSSTISVVLAVQVIGSYRKDDAGTRIVANHLVSAGTEVAGAPYSIPNAYVYVSDLFVLDPNGGTPWTVASVNALQGGYALVS